MAEKETEYCAICELKKSAHIPGQVNHQFSLEGELVPLRSENSPRRPAQAVQLGRLIGMLANKGILSPDEVGRLLAEDI